MDSTDLAYARDRAFWQNYFKARPQAPQQFFDRIFKYHEEHGGEFGVVHDAGAGVGPYAAQLKRKFKHVILSDIDKGNVDQAREKFGTDGFSYRVAKAEQADDIEAGSVDLVFMTNMSHFPKPDATQDAIARQLKSGGTFLCACFGIAVYQDPKVDEIWSKLRFVAQRGLLKTEDNKERRYEVMSRLQSGYDSVPVDEKYFLPGALRIRLHGGLSAFSYAPSDIVEHFPKDILRIGPNDRLIHENMEGWSFTTDFQGLKDQFATYAFTIKDTSAFPALWEELQEVVGDRELEGFWPAQMILATRR